MDYYKNLSLEILKEVYEDILYIEEWKPIKGSEGLYEISSFGRVKSLSAWQKNPVPKILKQAKDKDGYLQVTISPVHGTSKDRKSRKIHKLVANAFIPNPEKKSEVNHKKGIKTDNRVHQLEWNTSSENKLHAYEHGLIDKNTIRSQLGKTGRLSSRSKKIAQLTSDGELVNEYSGAREAARVTGLHPRTINGAATGRPKTYAGYIWKYV